MSDSKEEARIEWVKAQMKYSQICTKINRARKMLPPKEERSPEEMAFWMMLCNASSKCSKAVLETEQKYKNFDSKPKKIAEDRLQELMTEVDFTIEKEEVERKLNPKKLSIYDIPWAKKAAEAATKFVPKSGPPNPLRGDPLDSASEDEEKRRLDEWFNSPSPAPAESKESAESAESADSKEAEDDNKL